MDDVDWDTYENEFDGGVLTDIESGIESVWLLIIWCGTLIVGLAIWTTVAVFALRVLT